MDYGGSCPEPNPDWCPSYQKNRKGEDEFCPSSQPEWSAFRCAHGCMWGLHPQGLSQARCHAALLVLTGGEAHIAHAVICRGTSQCAQVSKLRPRDPGAVESHGGSLDMARERGQRGRGLRPGQHHAQLVLPQSGPMMSVHAEVNTQGVVSSRAACGIGNGGPGWQTEVAGLLARASHGSGCTVAAICCHGHRAFLPANQSQCNRNGEPDSSFTGCGVLCMLCPPSLTHQVRCRPLQDLPYVIGSCSALLNAQPCCWGPFRGSLVCCPMKRPRKGFLAALLGAKKKEEPVKVCCNLPIPIECA